MKVRRGRVVEMSKTMDPAEADGENLGIVKFGAAGASRLVEIMDRLVADGELRAWAPRAFHEFARRSRSSPSARAASLDRDRLSRGLSTRGPRRPARRSMRDVIDVDQWPDDSGQPAL